MEDSVPFDLNAWLGRAQAFGLVANHCSASQAGCLRRIRESNAHTTLGLTWEDFCREHIGLSRQHVDTIIHNLEEFGAAYFRLSEIVRVSPDTYRQLVPAIQNEVIEFDGESIPIAPENAIQIRNAVHQLRRKLKESQSRQAFLAEPDLTVLVARFEICFREMNRMVNWPSKPRQNELRSLINFALDHLKSIRNRLPVLPE